MDILTKQQNFDFLEKGILGNKLRIWHSYEDILKSRYKGTVSIRYKGEFGGGKTAYEVKLKDIKKIEKKWVNSGANKERIVFNESAPDKFLLIQGELMKSPFFQLYYCEEPMKMRDAFVKGKVKYSGGLTAKLILDHFIDPSSLEDINCLLEKYDSHVIEFGTYSRCLGDLPSRNTIIWEVRKY
ncbi:MAG: hypothetical protein Q7S27_02050 [Nanoarchaeota archaeon]|nr:hypothetical protein [Nanoarchaeota archaeon]